MGRYNGDISIEELELEALRLAPRERARLAEKLLESLETLSDEENTWIWAEERSDEMTLGIEIRVLTDPPLMYFAMHELA